MTTAPTTAQTGASAARTPRPGDGSPRSCGRPPPHLLPQSCSARTCPLYDERFETVLAPSAPPSSPALEWGRARTTRPPSPCPGTASAPAPVPSRQCVRLGAVSAGRDAVVRGATSGHDLFRRPTSIGTRHIVGLSSPIDWTSLGLGATSGWPPLPTVRAGARSIGARPHVRSGVGGGCRWRGVQVTPVGVTVACRSWVWTWVWWRRQSRAALVRSVVPPRDHHWTWWASHQVAGRCSRGRSSACPVATTVRRWAGVKRRRVRPRSRTWPSAPRMAGMIPASQARRRTVAGERTSPVEVMPARSRAPTRASTSMVTSSWVLSPSPGRGPNAAPALACSCGVAAASSSYRRPGWSRSHPGRAAGRAPVEPPVEPPRRRQRGRRSRAGRRRGGSRPSEGRSSPRLESPSCNRRGADSADTAASTIAAPGVEGQPVRGQAGGGAAAVGAGERPRQPGAAFVVLEVLDGLDHLRGVAQVPGQLFRIHPRDTPGASASRVSAAAGTPSSPSRSSSRWSRRSEAPSTNPVTHVARSSRPRRGGPAGRTARSARPARPATPWRRSPPAPRPRRAPGPGTRPRAVPRAVPCRRAGRWRGRP